MKDRKIKNYLNGYIIVNIEGLNPEKFINLSARNNIKMWDIERINFTTLQLKMHYQQYKKFKRMAAKTNCRCRIIKKHGINFLLFKIEKRKYSMLGLVVFAAALIYFSSFIWSVDIYGNKTVASDKIYESLKNAGFSKGTQKNKINLRDVEAKVQKDIEEISIVNIKYSGTKARVEIVERTMPPSIDSNTPADIIAAKEGIILKVTALKGQPAVQSGDFVKKDQVLISGTLTSNENAALGFVHAKGTIYAKTWYESIKEVSINYKYNEKTGRQRKIIYFTNGKKKIYIKNDNIDFEKYDKIEEKHPVSIAGYDLPVEKVELTFYELSEKIKKLSYEDAARMALEGAEADIKQHLPSDAKFIDKKIERQLGNGTSRVKLLFIMEESIGVARDIK